MQDRIVRELDAVGAVGRVEDEAALVLGSSWRDTDHVQTPELHLGPIRGPQRGRIARGRELQEEPERDRTAAQSAVKLIAQKVGIALARLIGQ